MRLVYHCSRLNDNPMMYHGWLNINWDTFIPCLWWYMMNHELQSFTEVLTSCQSINGCMCDVDAPLYMQQSKGMTPILVIQHPKDIPWVDG